MIKYAKAILPEVTSWKTLFKKELIKCIQWAEPEECLELRNWCYDNFYELYPDVLTEVFNSWESLHEPVEINNVPAVNIDFQIKKLVV